jgi:enamine deaminase RidA (YjgF/YER057c/UK114 family)
MSGTTPWRKIDPREWAKPVGYTNAVESKPGRRISIAGQTAMGRDGKIVHVGDLAAQAGLAFQNVATVLKAASAKPEHLVRMRIFTTDVDLYRTRAKEIGEHYRAHFGKWFPAMTLVGVARLYDPGAQIEVEAEAVVPD